MRTSALLALCLTLSVVAATSAAEKQNGINFHGTFRGAHARAPDGNIRDQKAYESLKGTGANWLSLNIAVYQDTIDSTDTRQDTVGMAMAMRLQESSESLAEILAKLQVVREELVQLREKRVVAREVAVRIVARLADLETRLNRLASGIERLDARVAETRDDVGKLRQSFPWWTTVVALALTLLPVWFAVSQIVMARLGWRLIRAAR